MKRGEEANLEVKESYMPEPELLRSVQHRQYVWYFQISHAKHKL